MKKNGYRFLLVVMALMLVTVCTMPMAEAGSNGKISWQMNGTQLTIGGKGVLTSNVIPAVLAKKAKTVVIAKGITRLKGSSVNFPKMTSLQLPDTLKKIDMSAFNQNPSLRSISIPRSVTKVGTAAFSCSMALKKVTFEGASTKIGDALFEGCKKLTSVTLPKNLKALPYGTFKGCTSLKSIKLPAKVRKIGTYAFIHSGLTTIDLSKIVSIGNDAFYDSKLKTVLIPAATTSIGSSAFSACKNLTEIKVAENNKTFYAKDDALIQKADSGDILISVAAGKTGTYYVPEGVKKLGSRSFSGCQFSTVYLNDDLQEIELAFKDCSNLLDVYFGKNITYMRIPVDLGCDQLTWHVYQGSYAETYAQENEIPYVYR